MSLKTKVVEFLNDSQKLCRDCREADRLRDSLTEMCERLNRPLRVAVVGMMKAGKSTFMNALLGEKILCTGVLETTYTVGWFKYAEEPSITVCFRDGEKKEAPFEELEWWSVRVDESGNANPRLQDVKYLMIHYPSEILKRIEFIDTPGLNSIYGTDSQNTLDFLSINSSEDTLYEISVADAVIYAFNRSVTEKDKDILTGFQSGGRHSSPVNSIGILTKADKGEIWEFRDKTPVETVKKAADELMEREDLKEILFSIFPVCAKVMEGYIQLEKPDWELLKEFSNIGDDNVLELLNDSEAFIYGDDMEDMPGTEETRNRIINLVGQYGILEITRQLRKGRNEQEIWDILQERTGIQAVQEILEQHFGNRTFLIKTQYIFNRLWAVIHQIIKEDRTGKQLHDICGHIADKMEELMDSIQTLKELKALQMYYNGQIQFRNDEEKEDFLHITREYGHEVEDRLGVDRGLSVKQLEMVARKKADYWRGRGSDFMMPGTYVEMAYVLTRSYEEVFNYLNLLCEE